MILKNIVIENSYNYIDEEINIYFAKLESNILNKRITKRNLSKIINEDALNKFIVSIYENLNIILNDSIQKTTSCEIVEIIKINLNKHIINEYRNTRLLSEINENFFNELAENIDYLLFAKLLNVNFSNILVSIFETTHILSYSIKENHKKDLENRVKGNLLNIKYRLARLLKQQIMDYVDRLDVNHENVA